MRDVFITLILCFGWFYTFKKPYIGVLVWSWLSYMNPHRLSYGFAYDAPFAYITAIVLLLSMSFSRQTEKLPINTITVLWLTFVAFMGITTLFAYFPEVAWIQYVKIIKIQLIMFITMMLITDISKLNHLLWTIALSIGYFTVKGGVFTVLTGGSEKVWGPAGSYIDDNNALAVATLMTIPLMAYLYQITKNNWIRYGLLFAMITSFISSLGSQSRGALLAFGAVVMFFWFKSKRKGIVGVCLLVMIVGLLAFMPESWFSRMNTIQTYEEDGSALGRLNAWEYAFNAANDNFLGVGLDSWSSITFALYAPDPEDVHAAHSIYFSVLADHGWVGLILFLLIYFLAWHKLSRLINIIEHQSNQQSLTFLARMLQVSFIAYLVGGAFLSLSYFDLPWHLVSFVILLEKFIQPKTATLT